MQALMMANYNTEGGIVHTHTIEQVKICVNMKIRDKMF